MAECSACREEVDELVVLKIQGRKKKFCEDCAAELAEEQQMAEESEAVIQQMMGFTGRR